MNKFAVLFIIGLGLVVGWRLLVSPSTATLVSPEEFDQLAKAPNAFVLDVHTPEQTHIPGTDAFIPYDKIKENVSKLPEDKNTPILVYCRSGSMSREATQTLAKLGYLQVYDLAGGVNAYKHSHEFIAVVPDTKALGEVIYGDVAETEFTLTNFTPDPVTITRVSTSCGCTTAKLQKQELEAYDLTTVRVSFNPAFHKDDTDLGELTRTIYIETDNPNFSKLTAEITANVVKN